MISGETGLELDRGRHRDAERGDRHREAGSLVEPGGNPVARNRGHHDRTGCRQQHQHGEEGERAVHHQVHHSRVSMKASTRTEPTTMPST